MDEDFIVKTPGDQRARNSYSNLREVAERLLRGLIENEINSALIFVAVARTAFRAAEFSDGNAALSKAEAIYAQAKELAHDSSPASQQAIADSLRELRRSIDDLLLGRTGN